MSEPNNQQVIEALSQSVNFSFGDRTSFGALFGGANPIGNSSTSYLKGTGNTSYGGWSLNSILETSKSNTAFGYRCLLSNVGDLNTSFGFQSMLFVTTGSQNTGFGANTFDSLTLGDENVAFGFNAGKNLTNGSNNLFFGNNACVSDGNINNSIVIGNDAQASEDNQFVVGSAECNAGVITEESVQGTKTWKVVINGVECKILLA
jgi:hypothetical protein